MNDELVIENSIASEIATCSELVYDALDRLLPSDEFKLSEAMRYSLLSGGKCLRSFYLIKIGQTLGSSIDDLIIPAACIEMIHTYSLIHDDLPAMDNDDIRRGKASCHKQFDEATAILAGDSLLTLAFEILSSDNYKMADDKKNIIINLIAANIGYQGMAGGQIYDIIFENQDVNIEQICQMQGMKTAQLFLASGQVAAIISGQNEQQTAQIMKFSYALGLAFQIIDDILDEVGDEILIGKKTKKDSNRGKASLVSIFGVEEAKNQARSLIKWGLTFVKNEPNYDFFVEIAEFIVERKY